jgi:putative MATE family efflux protein
LHLTHCTYSVRVTLLSPPVSAETPPTPTRELTRIALPVSLEFVFQLGLGMIDQVVLALLGSLVVAGVGFANSVTLIMFLTFNAIGGGASILVARAHGAQDRAGASKLLGAGLVVGVTLSAITALPLVFGGERFLELIGAQPDVAQAGGPFLSVVSLSLPFITAAGIFSGALRSTGHARTPMTVALLAVGLNTVLAFGLVTGFGPFPKLGAVGVGIATIAAYALRAGLLAWQVYGRNILDAALPRVGQWKRVLSPLLPLSLPMAATELAWSGGTFLYALLAGRISTEALAGMQLSNTLEGVFIVASLGLGSAATVLIGQALGRSDALGARAWARSVQRSSVVVALGAGLLFALTAPLLGVLFPNVGTEARTVALASILINAAFQVVKSQNMMLGMGVLPSANDTRGVLLGDAVAAFVVGLPLAYLLAFPLGLGFWGLLIARVTEECAKLAIFIWRARQIDWDRLAQEGHQVVAH